ncbi:PIR Superfamily Protein, partial [Plasmodium ovale curtisi]
FTAFGTWAHSKILKRKIDVNLDQDAPNLFENELNNVDQKIYNDGYKVTYHPL